MSCRWSNSEFIKDQIEVAEKKIFEFKSILKTFEKVPEFKEIPDENKKEDLIINLFTIIYYFCSKYDVQKASSLLNSDEKIQKFLYKGFIKHRYLFTKTKFGKNIITNTTKNNKNSYINSYIPTDSQRLVKNLKIGNSGWKYIYAINKLFSL